MLAIDTLKLAEDLKKGGFTEEQTATLVDLGRDLSNQALEKVASKDDLKALEERIDDKFETLEERIDGKFEGVAKDMTTLEERIDGKFEGVAKDMTTLEERIDGKFEGVAKDMTALEERLDLKFDGFRKDVTAEMKMLEQRMIIKLGALIVAGVGILVLIDRLFPAVAVVTSAAG